MDLLILVVNDEMLLTYLLCNEQYTVPVILNTGIVIVIIVYEIRMDFCNSFMFCCQIPEFTKKIQKNPEKRQNFPQKQKN